MGETSRRRDVSKYHTKTDMSEGKNMGRSLRRGRFCHRDRGVCRLATRGRASHGLMCSAHSLEQDHMSLALFLETFHTPGIHSK